MYNSASDMCSALRIKRGGVKKAKKSETSPASKARRGEKTIKAYKTPQKYRKRGK